MLQLRPLAQRQRLQPPSEQVNLLEVLWQCGMPSLEVEAERVPWSRPRLVPAQLLAEVPLGAVARDVGWLHPWRVLGLAAWPWQEDQ